jgi:hypothetical protein
VAGFVHDDAGLELLGRVLGFVRELGGLVDELGGFFDELGSWFREVGVSVPLDADGFEPPLLSLLRCLMRSMYTIEPIMMMPTTATTTPTMAFCVVFKGIVFAVYESTFIINQLKNRSLRTAHRAKLLHMQLKRMNPT